MNNISNLTINQYQELVNKLVFERRFEKETVSEVFTLLIEEIGELAKAIRKQNGQKIDRNRKQYDIEEEAADVFWLLLDLCNRLEIDLGKSFSAKELKNSTRKWD